MPKFGLCDDANTSSDEIINADVAEVVVCKKFRRFKKGYFLIHRLEIMSDDDLL